VKKAKGEEEKKFLKGPHKKSIRGKNYLSISKMQILRTFSG